MFSTWVPPAALALLTLALYAPSLTHDFIKYDDQQYVTENVRVQAGLTWHGVVWACKSAHASNWHPLTWLSHMFDCQLYGLRPAGHHLTNVLLHTANSLLLFLLLRRLTRKPWRSFAVAALFAWHPLHVESVAWIAERKDVLSALFFLLTLWAWTHYARRDPARPAGVDLRSPSPPAFVPDRSWNRLTWYLLSLVLFALALMSKPMVVTLPFVLLLLDLWPLGRLQLPGEPGAIRKVIPLVLEKIPFFILSAGGCLLTLWAQRQAMVSTVGLPLVGRAEHALVAYAHYVGALIVPRHLAVYYPYEAPGGAGEVLLAGGLLVLVSALALGLLRRHPWLGTGWFWFVGMLVPVIGLVQVGGQAWADRYTYLPSIGFFLATVWVLGELAERSGTARKLLPWLAVPVAGGLLAATSIQLSYWKNTGTLFRHVDAVTRRNPLSTTVLGSLLAAEGKYDQAIEYYHRALSYSPGFLETRFYLGYAFEQQGRLDEAIAQYQQAIRFKAIAEQCHIRMGATLARQHKLEAAVDQYQAALRINPDSALAHNNLAKVLHSQGRLDEAIAHYAAAIKADASLSEAHNNMGVLLLQKGRVAEGIAELRQALRLRPGDPEAELNLAQGLVDQEQWSEAAALFARTVTAQTSDANVRCRYATALAHLHRSREAISQYAAALLLQPDFAAALDGLSWILATDPNPQCRNGTEAVRMAERACELSGRKDPAKLKTLAAAYAETGRFADAVATAQTAHDLAAQNSHQRLADECLLLLEQFKAAKPWRQQD